VSTIPREQCDAMSYAPGPTGLIRYTPCPEPKVAGSPMCATHDRLILDGPAPRLVDREEASTKADYEAWLSKHTVAS
jgi:hypothetical protein